MKNQITQVHSISPEDFKKEIVEDVATHISVILEEIVSKIQPKQNSEFITSKEAASFLQVTLPTLYDWRKKGIVIAYRIANKIRYKRSEIENSLIKINESYEK
ncbi:helix-turn-helix domain-containing protein [Urechidicola croceus]|uniref:Helix-turn-helix domain-containing protein n=1 Tax=Urechidicola croceus TaxID=1850246 RepID=A0A1D8P7P5_9FLAO|nr:helix-turn-helix domain-containing protein [Urechidicola croceus]AOW20594.1 hypothetical protein LPB138_07845 [Urechidicola croceus]